MHIMCVKGSAGFVAGGKEYALSPADTYFVPAGMGKVTLLSSDAVVITTTTFLIIKVRQRISLKAHIMFFSARF